MDLYPRFSDKEYERRYDLIRKISEEKELDVMLVYGSLANQAEINYLTQYLPRAPTWLIIPYEGIPILLTHFYNHLDNAKALSVVKDVRWIGRDPVSKIVEVMQQVEPRTKRMGVIGLGALVPYGQFSRLTEARQFDVIDLSAQFLNCRIIKSEEEIDWHRKGAQLTDLALEALEKRLRPGMSEYELSAVIQSAYLTEGGLPGIHFVSVTSMHQPDRRVPWQYPSSQKIQRGSVVNTEISAMYWGYGGQIHRPFAVGEEPTQLYRRLYDVALEAYYRIAKILRPGTTAQEIVKASEIIEEAGFTSCDSIIHGIGVTPPEIGSKSSVYPVEETVLQENMVITVQPNPTTPDGRAGVQVGSTLAVRNNGGENLHNYPFKFTICK